MGTRLFAALLAALLLLSLAACSGEEDESEEATDSEATVVSSDAEEETEDEPDPNCAELLEDFKYTEEDGVITITGIKKKNVTSCKIPEEASCIAGTAFRGNADLESIEIHDGVVSIGLGAFNGCVQLIETDGSVSYVDRWAVDCTEDAENVTLRSDTVGIADSVFAGCAKVKQITIPSTVKQIGAYAFSRCTALKSVELPEGISSLREYTFFACSSLESASLPKGVETVGVYAFGECGSLAKVTLPSSVSAIGEGAFYRCDSLDEVSYGGNAEAWKKIDIDSQNQALTDAY